MPQGSYNIGIGEYTLILMNLVVDIDKQNTTENYMEREWYDTPFYDA